MQMPVSLHSTTMNKESLIEAYVTRVIDGLDLDDCLAILHDYMTKSYDDYSYSEMEEEVKEYYPELLDSDTEPDESTGWN